MKFLPRSRKGNPRATKDRASSALIDRRSWKNDPPVGPEQLIESWKHEIDREEAPQHCMSLFTKKSKRKSLLDEESTQSKPVEAVAARVAEEQITREDDEDEARDPHPMALADMKEQTMKIINKALYGPGKLRWSKVEELIRFWTKQGTEESVHLSIILYDRMAEDHEKAKKWSDGQMMFWLKSLIQNWNQGQRENLFETFSAKDMIEQIETWENCIQLDPEIYSTIIDGAAYSQPYLADSLLRRAVESRNKGLIYSHTYNLVIRAWVDAGDPYQAEALLDVMLSEWRNRRDGGAIAAKPNRQSFHWVLLGWANSNESVAAERTEHILEKMDMYAKTRALSSIKPNAATYKWVLDSLIKASNRSPIDNAERAESILELLQEKADNGEEDFRPRTEMYSVVIAAWGNAGDPDRGEELLHQLYKDYCDRNHDQRLQPNLELFNNLLIGWSKVTSKSDRKKAGERAEAILMHMEKLASTNVLPGVKPNLKSYNTLLECWARCADGDRAQEVLERMIERWESGDDVIAPNTVSYSHVIAAWNRAGDIERCEHIVGILYKQFMELDNYRVHPNLILGGLAMFGKQPGASRKAKQLFKKMEDLNMSRQREEMKPNTMSYRHMLECICKSDRSQSGAQAEAILNEMIAKYSTGEEDVKPDVNCYNLVMKTLIKTKQPKRCEEVLAQMYEEDVRGARVYPNLETFNTILMAWAKSGLGDEACKRSEQVLRRLERIHESRILHNVKPDVETYNIVLDCMIQTPHPPNSGERAERIMDQMEEKGVIPNALTYNRVVMALKNSGDIKRANQLLRKLKRKASSREDDRSHKDAISVASIQWF